MHVLCEVIEILATVVVISKEKYEEQFLQFAQGAYEPFPKNGVSHSHRQSEINKPKDKSSASPPTLIDHHRLHCRSEQASQFLTGHEIQLWVVTEKRHSAQGSLTPPFPLPALHAAMMGNEPALALLKRKHTAEFNQKVDSVL